MKKEHQRKLFVVSFKRKVQCCQLGLNLLRPLKGKIFIFKFPLNLNWLPCQFKDMSVHVKPSGSRKAGSSVAQQRKRPWAAWESSISSSRQIPVLNCNLNSSLQPLLPFAVVNDFLCTVCGKCCSACLTALLLPLLSGTKNKTIEWINLKGAAKQCQAELLSQATG